MKTLSLEEVFGDDLRDPAFVSEYLQVSLEENGPEGLILALQRVSKARVANANVATAREANLTSFQSVHGMLSSLGLEMHIAPAPKL